METLQYLDTRDLSQIEDHCKMVILPGHKKKLLLASMKLRGVADLSSLDSHEMPPTESIRCCIRGDVEGEELEFSDCFQTAHFDVFELNAQDPATSLDWAGLRDHLPESSPPPTPSGCLEHVEEAALDMQASPSRDAAASSDEAAAEQLRCSARDAQSEGAERLQGAPLTPQGAKRLQAASLTALRVQQELALAVKLPCALTTALDGTRVAPLPRALDAEEVAADESLHITTRELESCLQEFAGGAPHCTDTDLHKVQRVNGTDEADAAPAHRSAETAASDTSPALRTRADDAEDTTPARTPDEATTNTVSVPHAIVSEANGDARTPLGTGLHAPNDGSAQSEASTADADWIVTEHDSRGRASDDEVCQQALQHVVSDSAVCQHDNSADLDVELTQRAASATAGSVVQRPSPAAADENVPPWEAPAARSDNGINAQAAAGTDTDGNVRRRRDDVQGKALPRCDDIRGSAATLHDDVLINVLKRQHDDVE
eukprot:gene21593-25972_t